MFTGIVQGTARIHAISDAHGGRDMHMELAATVGKLDPGQSVALDGVCLTVAEVTENAVRFRVMNESLQKTTLGSKEVGTLVNVEPSLTPSDELGGHFVYGHVDGIGTIRRLEQEGDTWYVTVAVSEDMRSYLMPQGAIALDGISLTIARLAEDDMTIAIIPYTWSITNLQEKNVGDPVNVEADMIMKGVVSYMKRYMNQS